MSEEKRVALVTGGRRGIGLGIARSLALAGYDLAISAVSKAAAAQDVLRELSALGAEVCYCQAEISDAVARLESYSR